MAAQISNAELGRRLDAVAKQVDGLPDKLAQTYVRQDVYEVETRASALQMEGIEVELQHLDAKLDKLTAQRDAELVARDNRRRDDRRLVLAAIFTALVGPVIVAFILRGLGGG